MNAAATDRSVQECAAKITLFTSRDTLTKSYFINRNGELSKRNGGQMTAGSFETISVTPATLRDVITQMTGNQALGLGVCQAADTGLVITEKKQAEGATGYARTKANWAFVAGQPGVLMLDCDYHASNPWDTPAEAVAYLERHIPALTSAPIVYTSSASSYLYDHETDDELQGLRGCRVYVFVRDAADIARAGAAIFDRLQLNATDEGALRYDVAKNGALLLRGRIDAGVFSPERLDFAGGASCGEGIDQRREICVLRADAEPLDTAVSIPDLDPLHAEALRAKRKKVRMSDAVRRERLAVVGALDTVQALPERERAHAVRRHLDAIDGGRMPASVELKLQDGTIITVADVLADPAAFDGVRMHEPTDWEYGGDNRIAVIQVRDGVPRIYSHAHGGMVWTLGELKTPANDNEKALVGELLPPAEAALSECVVFQGLDASGNVHMWDVRSKRARVERLSKMASKPVLLSLAPVSAWQDAISKHDGGEKFSIDAAFSMLVDLLKEKPEYQPKRAQVDENALTGIHGADSAIIAGWLRETTIYDEFTKKWFSWQTIWRKVSEGDVHRIVIDALDNAFARQYEQGVFNGTFNMLKMRLGRSPAMSGNAALDVWNADKNLLPMQNGVLDLRTGELLEHAPELMFSWMIPHDYNPHAECPTILKFIRQLAQDDRSAERVLLAWLAAILYGRADLQKYLELIGFAGTGKSTYIKICEALVGESNIAVTTMKTLNENQFETANLHGKRLTVITDADKYGGSVDIFKAITGQDPIRYEEKNQQAARPFIYGGMVVVAANQPIQFSDTSTAMPRRRIPVHIDKRLDSSEIDVALSEKLAAEIPGLINLLLQMPIEAMESALLDKEKSRLDSGMRAMCETNPIAAWLNDWVVMEPNHAQKIGTTKHDFRECLYPSYAHYCETTGRKGVIGLQNFTRSVLEVLQYAGIDAQKLSRKTGRCITGIRLRTSNDNGKPPMLYGTAPEVDLDVGGY